MHKLSFIPIIFHSSLFGILDCKRVQLTTKSYRWKDNLYVSYIEEGNPTAKDSILLLPGFGVGTFHYEENINYLSKDFKVYSLDLMGQGKSWPQNKILAESSWNYGVDSWRDQIIYFIENIIQDKQVHIAGNSLGGFLSVMVASYRPDLVKSLTLLNPAPFWGFFSRDIHNLGIWNGNLPPPPNILRFGAQYFNILRNPTTIKTMLDAVYAKKEKVDETLISNIIKSASDKGGHEAFTSILFSPKSEESFEDMLTKVTCPVVQINGKDDPWIIPFWGQRIKRILPNSHLIELAPCGHCPHHESPEVVNEILQNWIRTIDKEDVKFVNDILVGVCGQISAKSDIHSEVVDGEPRSLLEYIGKLTHINPSSSSLSSPSSSSSISEVR